MVRYGMVYPKAKVTIGTPTVSFRIDGKYPPGDLPNIMCTPDDGGCALDFYAFLHASGIDFSSQFTKDSQTFFVAVQDAALVREWLDGKVAQVEETS